MAWERPRVQIPASPLASLVPSPTLANPPDSLSPGESIGATEFYEGARINFPGLHPNEVVTFQKSALSSIGEAERGYPQFIDARDERRCAAITTVTEPSNKSNITACDFCRDVHTPAVCTIHWEPLSLCPCTHRRVRMQETNITLSGRTRIRYASVDYLWRPAGAVP